MRLNVPYVDGRSALAECRHYVDDLDTGNRVGFIDCKNGDWVGGERTPTRYISLFSGKYTGSFETHDECVAFAEGVQAVLHHMVCGDHRPFEESQEVLKL